MPTTLPPDFWEAEHRRLLAVLGPAIERAALAGVQAASRRMAGIGINYELANQAAADWARRYTDQLLQQLGTTSEALVGDALARWIETPGSTMGDLVGLLTPRFEGNAARADLIAVTETTRAYANGEMASYIASGIERIRWNTNRDEEVCPICRPLNGKVVGIGEPFGAFRGKPFTAPPSHPGCRCWISPVAGGRDTQDRRSFAPKVREIVEQEVQREVSQAAEQVRRQVLTGAQARQRVLEAQQALESEKAEILARRERMQQEVREIDERGMALVEKRNKLSPDSPERSQIDDELRSISREISRCYQTITISLREELDLQQRTNSAIREALKTDRPAQLTSRMASRFDKARKTGITDGLQTFRNMVDTSMVPAGSKIEFKAAGAGRSSYQIGTNMINATKSLGSRTAVHELGHWLEDINPDVRRQALEFLRKRAGGEQASSLQVLTGRRYMSGERAFKDNFIDPYMGKDYGGRATEIISMGMEYYVYEPIYFATRDPEYFEFIHNLVKGFTITA